MKPNDHKVTFNLEAKKSMRAFLRRKTWEEKVEAMERMNVFSRTARAAMRKSGARGGESA